MQLAGQFAQSIFAASRQYEMHAASRQQTRKGRTDA
jgi:hypothetical protein